MESKSVVESLILEIRNRPCLWDKKHDLYKHRSCLDKVWDEVAQAVNKNKDQIKIKWRNLRDQFSRELKKNPVDEDGSPIIDQYQGKWVYYELLTFLKDSVYLKPAGEKHDELQAEDLMNTQEDDAYIVIKTDLDLDEDIEGEQYLDPLDRENVQEIHDDTSDSTMATQIESNERPRRRLSQRKSKSSYTQRQMGIQSDRLRATSRHVDDDLHFALSLVPYLRRLDPLKKLIVRNEMQNLLIGELIGESSSRGKTSKK